jgi:hypothetical protein
MGHSAKYGCYTMLNCNLTKLVHFELLQVVWIILLMPYCIQK